MIALVHQQLAGPKALAAWEPIDGHASVTCKILGGATGVWELREYDFLRVQDSWIIDTNPGLMRHESWELAVNWFCQMRPIEIDLLTTVQR